MPSPYVRRRRLAAELRRLREGRGLTTKELARRLHCSRTKIAQLENAQIRPDPGEIMAMLDAFEIEGLQYDRLLQLAREAAQKGWWDRYGLYMGSRQMLAAELEHHADSVRGYDQAGMPGALQSRPFIEELVKLDQSQRSIGYQPEPLIEARLNRRRELLGQDGPEYETILDECVIHRLAVPPRTMAAQLDHMIQVILEEERLSVRVLRHDARLPGGLLPRSSFYLYTFPEDDDPAVAVVDTVTTDFVLDRRSEVVRYAGMFDRLRDAALPPEDSIAFLERAADRLTDQ
ncbi:helix-turn-helix transcriptional regulator [Actinomadura sp. WMMA1423]|uniref:helix-turn-helix domain-containing protein n=1 Tax=Actinomadura sp. WMMA1423 TaxID=2591108 RepID=UPI0011462B24|nr:helix-turn-helix transcriptional regulator [Actinomadura sp. WMMA1423]